MEHVHRELLDPALAPQCEMYVQKLRALHKQGVKWFVKTVVTDTYRADLKIDKDHLHVRMWPTLGVSYEFFTSDHVSDNTLTSPGHAFTSQPGGFVCGSATRVSFKNNVASPGALSSSTLDPGSPAKWISRDCESTDLKTLGFYTRRSWQDQKFFEHCWHPNNDGKALVTSTQAQAPGLAGQCDWMSPYSFRRIASAGSLVSDFGKDVQPTYYSGSGITSGAPDLDYPWVDWRRAAVQSVGGYKFFISTDSYGRFQIYPVKNYDATGGIVPVGQYRQFTPPYPGWVTLPDPSNYQQQVNDWLWRFNKDATKCVSIPYHSTFPTGFSKFLAGEEFFATIIDSGIPHINPLYSNAVVPAREDTPGLVEFGIEIVLGDDIATNPMAFGVNFTLLRESYFGVSGRFFFDAAYFLKDVENISVAEDTLVTAEIECKYPAGYYTAASLDGNFLDAAANVKGHVVINTNDLLMNPTEKLRFPTFPGGNAQFCTPAGYLSIGGTFAYIGPGPIGNDIPYINAITGLPVSLYTGSAGPTSYTPPDPPFTPGLYGAQLGFLYALELSTLSVLYQVQDQVAGTFNLRMLMYNTEMYSLTGSLGYTHPASPWPDADTTMPSVRWYHQLLGATINTEWGMGFNVHPLGHWSHSINAELSTVPAYAEALDWISFKKKDGTRLNTTHKAMFDKAFGQARDYTYYTEAYPGKLLWDQGSFRTFGIWVTYR